MPTYTLGQLDQACLDRVDQNSALYTKPERTAIINESLSVLNLFCGFYQATIQVPGFSQPDQLLYRTPAGIIIPTRVTYEMNVLRPLSLKALARQRPKFARESSDNYGPPAEWVPLGIGLFLIHPMDHDGGGDLSVTGIATPPALVNDGDVITIEDEYCEIVTEYFGHRAPLKEGGQVFADAAGLYKLFLSKMKQRSIHESLRLPAYWTKSLDQGAQE